MADLSFSTTQAAFTADLAKQDWTADQKAAATAAAALSDMSKGTGVEVNVAYSAAGGWCVVRIAPFNQEG